MLDRILVSSLEQTSQQKNGEDCSFDQLAMGVLCQHCSDFMLNKRPIQCEAERSCNLRSIHDFVFFILLLFYFLFFFVIRSARLHSTLNCYLKRFALL